MSDVVQLINERLRDDNERLIAGFGAPALPVTFILSQARAASTLFIQVVASCYRIGYASNLLSRFSDAPYIGAQLQASLEDPDFTSSFRTDFVTSGPAEPHEWGWFWRRAIGLPEDSYYLPEGQTVDIAALTRTLGGLEQALGAPLLFDNIFAQCNLNHLHDAINRLLTVHLNREPFYVCNSILNARLRRHGDLSVWYGNCPRDYDRIQNLADPVEQVVEQVWSTEQEIAEITAEQSSGQHMKVDYDDLSASPGDVADQFAACLSGFGVELTPRPTRPQMRFTSRNHPGQINPVFADQLRLRFRDRFGYLPEGVA